jgi:transposase-like protein
MANKGQKFKKYTNDEKKEFIRLYKEELSAYEIERQYGVSAGTIKTWMYKINHDIEPGKRGRPRNDDNIDYKERYEILKNFQAFLKESRQEKR